MYLLLTRNGSYVGQFRPKDLQRLLDQRVGLRPLKEDQLLFLFFCHSHLRHRRTWWIRFAQFDNPKPNRLARKPLAEGRERLTIVRLLQHTSGNRRLFGKANRHEVSFNRDQSAHLEKRRDIRVGMGDVLLELFPVELYRLQWTS